MSHSPSAGFISPKLPAANAATAPAPRADVVWRCLPFGGLSVTELYAVLQLRSAIFVVEQACVFQDMDGLDPACHHLLGHDAAGTLLAYARLVPSGRAFAQASVGRVVTSHSERGRVRASERGYSLGHALMAQACTQLAALWGSQPIRIGAQAHLQAFYGQHGFVTDSPEYIEDGIPHVEMLRVANPAPV